MKVNGCLTQEFVIERGIRQGSVLSPTLFRLIIESLLRKLKDANQGDFVGSLAHADDLHRLTCDPHSCEKQGAIIKEFLTENFLLLVSLGKS